MEMEQTNQSATPVSEAADTAASQEASFRLADSDTSTGLDQTASESVRSLFTGHELKVREIAPEAFVQRNPDWFTLILFGVIIWLSWTRVVYRKILSQLFSAFLNMNTTNQIVRDENLLVQRASVMLSLIFYITLSLLAYQTFDFFSVRFGFLGQGIQQFLLLLLFAALMYSVKTIVIKVLGNILKSERPAVSYIFNLTLINNFTGLLLLPLLVLVSYLDSEFVRPFFYLAFAVLSISFIYRQVRALRIWYSLQGVSFFYLILYICTLEISPLLILIRLARG